MFARPSYRSFGSILVSIALALIALVTMSRSLLTARATESPSNIIIVNPGDSIQAAINVANPGDTILINTGTYTENLILSKPVSLTGVNSRTVIIRAASAGSVLTVDDSSITTTVIISGLTFTGGSTSSFGGGILISNGAQPLIQHVVIANNYASSEFGGYGGGIYSSSSLTLLNVEFADNTSENGGGLYLVGGTAVMTNCDFIWNKGGGARINGAAVVIGGRFENNVDSGLRAGDVFVSGTQFISNSSSANGGGVSGATVVAINSLFERNTAANSGGGISANYILVLTNTTVISNSALWYGCGAYQDQYSGSASISNGLFAGNHCFIGQVWTNQGVGGGLYASGALTLTNTDFISNSAQASGGAHAWSTATIIGGRFERNSSLNPYTGRGGGMTAATLLRMTGVEFISNTAPYRGGGLQVGIGDNAQIVNTLFADNTTDGSGAGLYLFAGEGASLVNVTVASANLNPKQGIYISGGAIGITNTIVSNHAVGLEREDNYYASVVFEDYNLFYGNTRNLSGTISSGGHHPIGDPKFVDPLHGDYHLRLGSAAIDTGANVGISIDIDGEARPYGIAPDIGADEYHPSTLPAAVTDLRVTTALTDSHSLTATLRWTAPINAVTYTLRYSVAAIDANNWNDAINITVPFTAAMPGSTETLTATIPYTSGTVYFAINTQNSAGVWSGLSNNAFWPHHNVYLPLTRR